VLETVKEGGVFGEKSLIDDNPHTTSAIAKTDAEVVRVDEEQFLLLVHETPMFSLQVMRTQAQRTRVVMELALK
jgi:CRP/FNR family transcriptional regulator, cyclic AMP receptor protein